MNIFKGNNRYKKGFTLLETLIYFTLLSIILLIVVDLFFRISENSLESSSKSAVEIEGEYVLNRIAYDIHRFDTVGGDILLGPLDPGDSTPWLIITIDGVNYIYVQDPGIFTGNEIVFGESFVVADRLTSNSVRVSELSFTHISNPGGKPTIKVDFTLHSTKPFKNGDFEARNFESVFSIR